MLVSYGDHLGIAGQQLDIVCTARMLMQAPP
jgi:hypothetical protein